jgi:hypothetical protein
VSSLRVTCMSQVYGVWIHRTSPLGRSKRSLDQGIS